jgi:propanediol dehydratase small subunit
MAQAVLECLQRLLSLSVKVQDTRVQLECVLLVGDVHRQAGRTEKAAALLLKV